MVELERLPAVDRHHRNEDISPGRHPGDLPAGQVVGHGILDHRGGVVSIGGRVRIHGITCQGFIYIERDRHFPVAGLHILDHGRLPVAGGVALAVFDINPDRVAFRPGNASGRAVYIHARLPVRLFQRNGNVEGRLRPGAILRHGRFPVARENGQGCEKKVDGFSLHIHHYLFFGYCKRTGVGQSVRIKRIDRNGQRGASGGNTCSRNT